jgi:hypothetical protein
MKPGLSRLAVVPLLAAMPVGGAHAAISPLVIPAVLASCPVQTAGLCEEAAEDFLDIQPPGAQRDADIVKLVLELANAAKHPNITMPMCIELQKTIVMLGQGVTQAAPQEQVKGIAASLCDPVTTASIAGGGSVGSGPFPSLSEPGTAPDNPGGGTPPPGNPPPDNNPAIDNGTQVRITDGGGS